MIRGTLQVPAMHLAHRARSTARVTLAVVVTAVAAGLCAVAIETVLHVIQHVAFGFDLSRRSPAESFLEGVMNASPGRRLSVLAACGLVAGLGWWALARYGAKPVSVADAVGSSRRHGAEMPLRTTLVHIVLQVSTVALGSPLGREVAPREAGALVGGAIARLLGMTAADMRAIVACAAGAGLAAVYNVPFSGALFALEVLLVSAAPRHVLMAIGCCFIAAAVAWCAMGDQVQYSVRPFATTPELVVWACLCGPVFGVAATAFSRLTSACRRDAPRDWRRIAWCLVAFTMIGAVAAKFPEIPGNGRGPTQLAFDGGLGLKLAAALLLLKVVAVAASLRAGAAGGLLTPGLTIGALIAVLLGATWSTLFPGTPVAAFAVVGSAAFLATSMNMPITAIALSLEFTRSGYEAVLPLGLAVAGSVGVHRLLARGRRHRFVHPRLRRRATP